MSIGSRLEKKKKRGDLRMGLWGESLASNSQGHMGNTGSLLSQRGRKGEDERGNSLKCKETTENHKEHSQMMCVGTITMADESKQGTMAPSIPPNRGLKKLCTLSLVRRRKVVIVDTPVTSYALDSWASPAASRHQLLPQRRGPAARGALGDQNPTGSKKRVSFRSGWVDRQIGETNIPDKAQIPQGVRLNVNYLGIHTSNKRTTDRTASIHGKHRIRVQTSLPNEKAPRHPSRGSQTDADLG